MNATAYMHSTCFRFKAYSAVVCMDMPTPKFIYNSKVSFD